MYYLLIFISLLCCVGCKPQKERSLKENLQGDYIYRLQSEYFFLDPPPIAQPMPHYPWEERYIGAHPRITKEFFRCKGNPLNPVITEMHNGTKYYRDCPGGRCHGLPLREGEEFIYPCLLELLNYIQAKTGKAVRVTCGHCCPKHNDYLDHRPSNWGSKHMIGAELDFYVEGMEMEPLTIVALLQSYYNETAPFANHSEYTHFQRYTSETLSVSTPPWYNKEIFIKLSLPHEGRDLDNQHPYPYLTLQVRYDRELQTKVSFNQQQAQNYLRF